MKGSEVNRLRRKRALADALSGVAGSLISLWTFYPIEVWKTNLQAGSLSKKSLYQGCEVKTLHTASSNFCYFFLYSWIFAYWKRHKPSSKTSPAVRLFLAALAAMANTMITLPLDVISSQQVTQTSSRGTSTSSGKKIMEDVWERLGENSSEDSEFKECVASLESQETQEQEAELEEDSGNISDIVQVVEDQNEKVQLIDNSFDSKGDDFEVSETPNSISSLWKGLTPALLLCSNPSINYTVFDIIKQRILTQRSPHRNTVLSMPEAFLVGLFAKFVATIATYPLIRAKVILMVSDEKSMLGSLIRTYNEEGVKGLYKGCNWQLLHTALKSALMMMVREKIAASTRRIVVGEGF